MTNYAVHTSTRYQRTVELTPNAPQLTYSGVTVQPTSLTYSWSDDEQPQSVKVGGLRVRKDGSLGAWCTIVRILVKAPPGSPYAAAPQWVRDLVTTDPS